MRSGTARSQPGDAQASPTYFEWKPSGNGTSIHLNISVIDQLEALIMKGFWSVPKRGAEVGGVLFGRVENTETDTTVYIDDFEAVECEYRRGPSFALSDADKRRLERTLRRGRPHRQVVGFYRSHTRLGLYLDQEDFGLIQSYFPGSSQVFLLVRPHASKPSVGGFFFWEEGTIHRQATYLEFPFSRAEILKARGVAAATPAEPEAAPPVKDNVPWHAARVPPPVTAVPRMELSHVAAKWDEGVKAVTALLVKTARVLLQEARGIAAAQYRRANWRTVAVMAAILVGLGAVEYQWVKMRARRAAPAAAETAYSPALRIERIGHYLHVNWNRGAPSILNAKLGLLEIRDGDQRRELRLDTGQLRTGSVAYAPAGDDVSFRLELVGAKSTVSESLRVVEALGRTAPLPEQTPPQAAATSAAPAPEQIVRAAPNPPANAVRLPAPDPPEAKRTARRVPRSHAYYDDGL